MGNESLVADKEISKAIEILAYLKVSGVEDIIICPGGRNAPFVEVLSKTGEFNTSYYFEERSASFYALGLCKKNDKPVAIITTSGTAVAETLPAVIEAHYQSLPLVVVSADRPKSYRGSGAPQAIDQSEILNPFCAQTFDLENLNSDFVETLSLNLPTHINICFDEPLLLGCKENYNSQLITAVKKMQYLKPSFNKKNNELSENKLELFKNKKALIILGALSQDEAEIVLPSIFESGLPIYAEAHSQLKQHSKLKNRFFNFTTKQLVDLFETKQLETVIRIGGVPVLKFWRLLQNYSNIPVLNFSKTVFSGIPRIKQQALPLNQLGILKKLGSINNINFNLSNDEPNEQEKSPEINKEELFLQKLSKQLAKKSHVFLGNSLPIREWDKVAQIESEQNYTSLRGANGIDGNIAYFFGLCEKDKPNYCIIGDLTALYDLPSGFIHEQILVSKIDFKIIIINNSGGKIFKKLFNNKNFENNHSIEFKGWAEMLKLEYQKITTVEQIKAGLTGQIIELVI